MNDLKDYAPSRIGRPQSGPQGEVTAALHIGSLRVPLTLHQKILDAVRYVDPDFVEENARSNQNKRGYIALLRRGLHQVHLGSHAMKLVDASKAIRRLLEGADSIDLEVGMCPRGVDPEWWIEQELERIQGAARQIQAGVREALRISRAATETERQLGVLSREGS